MTGHRSWSDACKTVEILAWLTGHPRSTATEVAVFADRPRAWAWGKLRELERKGLVISELDEGRVNRARRWSAK